MPIYEFKCGECTFTEDYLKPYTFSDVVKCPKCGGTMQKQFSAPAAHFNGGDWKNDWKSKK